MKNDPDSRLDDLLRAAKLRSPGYPLPEYGFETRLAAKIGEKNEGLRLWSAFIWRAIPIFGALMAGLFFWHLSLDAEVESPLHGLEFDVVSAYFGDV